MSMISLHRIFLVLVVALATACHGEPDKQDDNEPVWMGQNVLDLGELFSPEEEAQLSQFADSLEQVSGIDLVVCIVGDPGMEGIAGYASNMTRRIAPGKPGLNNGAIIYLSDQVREVKIEPGYGLEWAVGDTASGMIIESMRPYLKESAYLPALKLAMTALAGKGAANDWQLDQDGWAALDSASLKAGDILRLTGKGMPRSYDEGVPADAQFHPNFFIQFAEKSGGRTVPVFFTRYMDEMITTAVYGEGAVTIYCLVLNVEPLRLGLIGLDS